MKSTFLVQEIPYFWSGVPDQCFEEPRAQSAGTLEDHSGQGVQRAGEHCRASDERLRPGQAALLWPRPNVTP